MFRKFFQRLWLEILQANDLKNEKLFFQQEAISQQCQRIAIEIELEAFRTRLNKMHRRAQRAEASRTRAFNEMAAAHRTEIEEAHKAYLNVVSRLHSQKELFHEIFPFLHAAWLHHVDSDVAKANAIADIENRLRTAFPGIGEPPKPEVFSSGKPEGPSQ